MHDENNYRYITKNSIIQLTPLENIALALLIKNKGKIVTKSIMSKTLYNCEYDVSTNKSITNLICRLRKKLKGECDIISRFKIGYFIK